MLKNKMRFLDKKLFFCLLITLLIESKDDKMILTVWIYCTDGGLAWVWRMYDILNTLLFYI